MTQAHLDEREVRLQKLKDLQEAGINAYPSKVSRDFRIITVLEKFDDLYKTQESVSVAGRIMLLRAHGALMFAKIMDESGTIQLVFEKKTLGEELYKNAQTWFDLGDFISAIGKAFVTKKGEKSLFVSGFQLASKALRPLPEKWHGLQDTELKLRKRYIDLIMNEQTRELFRKRTVFIKTLRSFLDQHGFMEVETPVLEQVPGGAEANPFITHHDTLDINLYLRISLELHLKRLIVGGYEKIYEVGRVFRNEGMSTQHLQEFTMMECYWAYADYEDLLDFVQKMYQEMIQKTFGTLKINYKGVELDFSKPFERLDYTQLVKDKCGIDLNDFDNVEDLKKAIAAKKLGIKFDKFAGLGRVIDQLYKKVARPFIVQPTFLINQPLAISPLAKTNEKNPKIVQRMQVLIAGAEVGNGYSELNDPIDQKNRFLQQEELRQAGDAEAQMIDEDFIEALEQGMPPTAGFGVGIDRFFAILINAETIRDVVFFPTVKPEEK